MEGLKFKINKSNPRLPTWKEILKGKYYPGDIIEEVIVSAEDIKKMAILKLFGIDPPQHLIRADVMQAINDAINELVTPQNGIHTPFIETFLRTLESFRKNPSYLTVDDGKAEM